MDQVGASHGDTFSRTTLAASGTEFVNGHLHVSLPSPGVLLSVLLILAVPGKSLSCSNSQIEFTGRFQYEFRKGLLLEAVHSFETSNPSGISAIHQADNSWMV